MMQTTQAEVADELQERLHKVPAVDETPDVVHETPDVVDEIPEDKTLLYLIRRPSPDLAIEFLKLNSSLSHAALNSALILACQRGFKYLVQKLLHLGADIECRDVSGKTPLLICVENRYVDLVHFLVAKRADVKAVDCAGNNALILSISYAGSKKMTRFLLKQARKTLNHQNKEGYTAIMKALEARDVDTVKLLLECYHPQTFYEEPYHKYEDNKSWTLLAQTVNCKGETSQEIAEKYGLGDVFKLLKESRYKETSPLLAAVGSTDLEMVTFLLDFEIKSKMDVGNAINELFEEHRQNEIRAFTKNDVEIIKTLLECGVNLKRNSLPCYKQTCVSVAVEAGDYNLVELLCKHGAPLNDEYGGDKLPLNVAAKHGRVDLIELLLKYKADVNTGYFMYSPLDRAFTHGHIDCARFLINHGAKLDIGSSLESAVMNQSSDYMKFLFQNYKSEINKHFNKEPNNRNDLFLDAVKRGNQEIIEQILQAGVDINKPQRSGATPIVESKNGEVVQFLINCGADVNHQTSLTNETPLMHVLKKQSTYYKDPCTAEVVRVLLENAASVHAKTSDMTTPLMLAARVEGHEEILQTLLDHGADCSDRDKDGNTALVHAIVTSSPKNAMFLMQFMKNNTELLNLQNNEGFTALMCDVSRGACTVMSELIDGGADVNITDVNGNTALLHAVTSSVSESHLKVLINAGCDVNYQNNNGLSPLMLAVSKCNIPTVSALLSLGADVNAVSHEDASKTAISCVPKKDYFSREALSCIEVLIDNGAKASYLSPYLLPSIITQCPQEFIVKLIHCGLGPIDVDIDEMPLKIRQHVMLPSVSPLGVALLVDNVSLARYFWGNMFLTNADLFSLSSNKIVRRFLQSHSLEECLSFLDETSSEPMSLFKMSFVAVTSAVGASPGREARVNKLPLPQVMKDNLLFKSEFESLATQEDRDKNINISHHVTDYVYGSSEMSRYLKSEENNSGIKRGSLIDYYVKPRNRVGAIREPHSDRIEIGAEFSRKVKKRRICTHLFRAHIT